MHSLDNVGNRLTKSTSDTNYTYSYDEIYRLTAALSSAPGYNGNKAGKGGGIANSTEQQKEFYTYDPVGNRLTSDKERSYTYNQANQLISNGGIYTYDKNGNLTMMVDGTATFCYSYDYENRLTKVVKIENGMITASEYKYDPFGRRIEKKVTESGEITTTTTIQYVYDNEDIILEYDAAGNIGNRYIHGPGIDEPLAVINGKDAYYYHADGLGSVVALTDSSGKTVQTYEYDSFGNLKDQKNRVKQPFTYTAREWDKEAGLYYYRARYYDAKVGRFIESDPIGLKGAINLYVYAENNPIRFTDPRGLAVWVCSQQAQLPGGWLAHQMGWDHQWLKTNFVEAGYGPPNGQPAGSPMPGDPVTVTDHTGRSTQPGARCVEKRCIDEACVNRVLLALRDRPLGTWGPYNNCNTFVSTVLEACRL